MTKPKFAMLGCAGFVAPRHMKAIHDVGGELVAACDPYDGVGILDRWFPDCSFFTEVERFDRHLEKLRRRGDGVDFVSICTPNYLHDAHCRLALRAGADAICEKPLVLRPRNLDQLVHIERESSGVINTVLQLRKHESVTRLKRLVESWPEGRRAAVKLTYVTRRGKWYDHSWKGDSAKSGGVAMNVGIHFFDMLLWVFGPCIGGGGHVHTRHAHGTLEFERADVDWSLSVDAAHLPDGHQGHAFRCLEVDGVEFNMSTGFDDLHTRVYEDVLAGRGHGIEDARAAIELVHRMGG